MKKSYDFKLFKEEGNRRSVTNNKMSYKELTQFIKTLFNGDYTIQIIMTKKK